MASIKLSNLSVDFPIYNNRGRSLKNRLLESVVGGSIETDSGMSVVRALKNINIDIGPGDRYALLGHNGAGKSTLLKVMAGIYHPTTGGVEIQGDVLSMFDPSLGTSPEATGWENIETRGILLGLDGDEIESLKQTVSEISGLGDFLNMPIRTYSSGMRMRLAFCVSTAVRTEILLLDESVVVGDAGFLKMARKRLDNLIADANVLVLASHSQNILRQLCNKGIFLDKGEARVFQSVDELIEHYSQRI